MDCMLSNLDDLRCAGEFCDVLVTSRYKKKFYGHRVVLAAASPYFRAMLSQNCKEKETGIVHLPDAKCEILGMIMDYIYTGKLDLHEETALELYRLADRLQVGGIVDTCTDFLISHLHPTNCLGFRSLALACRNVNLAQAATIFLLRYFKEFTESDEFLDMELEQFKIFLRADELNVDGEEVVYDAVKKWIQHDESNRKNFIVSLIELIRFPMLEIGFLRQVMGDMLLKENVPLQFLKKIFDCCIDYHNNRNNSTFESESAMCFSIKPRIPPSFILVIGGWNEGRTIDIIESMNYRSSRWFANHDIRDSRRCYYAMAELQGEFYMAGGYDGQSYQTSVRKFDPLNKKWNDVSPLNCPRCFAAMVNLDDELYLLAGFDGHKRLKSVEKYSPNEQTWVKVRNSNTPRSDAAAVVLGQRIYLIGGFGNSSLSSVEYYCKNANAWYFVSSMTSRRSGCAAVALSDGRLFVMGGFNGSVRLDSTEFYDPSTNRWTPGPTMKVARSNFGACVIGNHVYAVGGYTGRTTVATTERFDTSSLNPQWIDDGAMSSPRSAMRAVVVSNIPNVEDYLGEECKKGSLVSRDAINSANNHNSALDIAMI